MKNGFLLLQLVFVFLSPISAQEQSDREQDGLAGYVKSVREEIAEIDFENGKQVEGGRQLSSIRTYDISGRLLTNQVYSEAGPLLHADTLIYDTGARLIEKKTEHTEHLNLCDKKTYVYDQSGRRSEEICHINDRGVIGKSVFRYNDRGKLVEEERFPLVEAKLYFTHHTVKRYQYNDAGKLITVANFQKGGDAKWIPIHESWNPHRSVYFSNENIRGSTRLEYDANGELVSLTIRYDDERGNELETVAYFRDGRIKSGNRYVYSYDRNGNYVKEVDHEWVTEDGKSFFQPTEVTYRTIEYFTPKEVNKYRKATRR